MPNTAFLEAKIKQTSAAKFLISLENFLDCHHGDQCDCQLLSMAATGGPNACSYSYCRKVLQTRWVMHCNHGGTSLKPDGPSPSHDPVIHANGSIELVGNPQSDVVDDI